MSRFIKIVLCLPWKHLGSVELRTLCPAATSEHLGSVELRTLCPAATSEHLGSVELRTLCPAATSEHLGSVELRTLCPAATSEYAVQEMVKDVILFKDACVNVCVKRCIHTCVTGYVIQACAEHNCMRASNLPAKSNTTLKWVEESYGGLVCIRDTAHNSSTHNKSQRAVGWSSIFTVCSLFPGTQKKLWFKWKYDWTFCRSSL